MGCNRVAGAAARVEDALIASLAACVAHGLRDAGSDALDPPVANRRHLFLLAFLVLKHLDRVLKSLQAGGVCHTGLARVGCAFAEALHGPGVAAWLRLAVLRPVAVTRRLVGANTRLPVAAAAGGIRVALLVRLLSRGISHVSADLRLGTVVVPAVSRANLLCDHLQFRVFSVAPQQVVRLIRAGVLFALQDDGLLEADGAWGQFFHLPNVHGRHVAVVLSEAWRSGQLQMQSVILAFQVTAFCLQLLDLLIEVNLGDFFSGQLALD